MFSLRLSTPRSQAARPPSLRKILQPLITEALTILQFHFFPPLCVESGGSLTIKLRHRLCGLLIIRSYAVCTNHTMLTWLNVSLLILLIPLRLLRLYLSPGIRGIALSLLHLPRCVVWIS